MFMSIFVVSLLTTIIFVLCIYPISQHLGLMDKPNSRKLHGKPIPLIGGIAIFLGVLTTYWVSDIPLSHPIELFTASGLLVVVGLIDDRFDLGVKYRIIAQIIAALIMAEFADIKITDLGDLLGFGNINLGVFSTAFTIFAVVGGINAFNMIDGIDGLAGTLALVSIMSVALVSKYFGCLPIYYLSISIIGAVIAFLLFNVRLLGRKSAMIFLGDTGSTVLGFWVCWISIYITQGENKLMPPTIVLWLIAVPLIDAVSVMYRRVKKNKSPWLADREHVHHYLQMVGYGVNKKLMILSGTAILFSILSIASVFILGIAESFVFITFVITFVIYNKYISKRWGQPVNIQETAETVSENKDSLYE